MAFTFSGLNFFGDVGVQPVFPPPPAYYLWSWGANPYISLDGALGLGNTTGYSSPKQVGSLATWLNIAAGSYFSSSIKTDGTIWTWGRNAYGQLGLGNTTNYSSPKQIGSLTDWATLANDRSGVSAIKTDGTLWSWGQNNYGQLGQNSTAHKSSPVQVGALTNWLKISASNYTVGAIKTDGTMWTWGRNPYGGLGLGTSGAYTNKSSPTQVGSLSTWADISTGYNSIAIKTDGTIWTWGRNAYGALGLGNTSDYSSPKQVGALTNWSKISAGAGWCAAIKTDGTLWTWGQGQSGKLGLGNTTNYSSPMQVGALTNWSSVYASQQSITSGIKTDGTLWTWGFNISGRLGLGDTIDRSSPTQLGSLTNWLTIAHGGAGWSLATKSS